MEWYNKFFVDGDFEFGVANLEEAWVTIAEVLTSSISIYWYSVVLEETGNASGLIAAVPRLIVSLLEASYDIL
jgi:hypothetical protein